ncbi:D-ribose pyranase [Kiloniella laminariae]|uniref:D-ribose pyranase n=1 Tax=Kiloniella laminariae TaxID=454162 RepID=A0ABT4LHS0_9PROT|nr:D-ribose pyranase [Kiloniella laminariae]MCZ4280649.1 D-ribose pyranase [Kiloniella laminariae]
MKKTALLNGPLSALIAQLGHGEEICISDAGLPIPETVTRIDLALTRGIPSFLDVLDAISSEMMVEKALVAEELSVNSSALHSAINERINRLETAQGNWISLQTVCHEKFKLRSASCRAVVRTGECTPYANIILTAGVDF